jgi:hypothetical protein
MSALHSYDAKAKAGEFEIMRMGQKNARRYRRISSIQTKDVKLSGPYELD